MEIVISEHLGDILLWYEFSLSLSEINVLGVIEGSLEYKLVYDILLENVHQVKEEWKWNISILKRL